MIINKLMRLSLPALAIALGAGPALAQQGYPTKPLRFIIPYAAGGLGDTVGRLAAQHLSTRTTAPARARPLRST
jgi:tripartite-type tricarboxylate transporter receptor subunit TctC